MITIDGYTVNPRDLFARATRQTVYEHGARRMHLQTNISMAACRIYAALIGERMLDPARHKDKPMERKPVVRTQQRRARLDLQDIREARE